MKIIIQYRSILFLFIIFLISFTFISCKNKDDFNTFEINYTADFDTYAGLSTIETHYFTVEVPSSYSGKISANGKEENQIVSVNPRSAYIESLTPSIDYEFIQNVSILIDSDAPGAYEQEIFYRENVPYDTDDKIHLIGTLVDAKPSVSYETFIIKVVLELRAVSPETISNRLVFSFNVKYNK